MVRFSKFFQLKISKLNFPSFGENNNNGQTAFLQVFSYFYIFHHIFGVYEPIFKIFSVIDIKIKFPVVWRKQLWRSDCLFCRFLAILYFFTFSPISLVFLVQFSNFFQLKMLKLNFPSFEENNNNGQTAFLQGFGYFYFFLHFSPYLWCLWSDFQNFFCFRYQN